MRPGMRFAVVALFGLMIGGAVLAGLASGRDTTRSPVPVAESHAAPSDATDRLIAGLLARIQRLPENADAHTQLGAAYLQKVRESGDPAFYTLAEAALSKSLSLNERNADTHLQLGVLALARHRFEEALAFGARARELNPYKAAALGVIGDAQVELGRYEEARATFQAMLDLRPDLASYARASYIHELHGDTPTAIELMKRAVIGASGSEAHAWTQVQLGHLYFNSGDLVAAEKEYQRTLFQRPDYAHANAGIARVKAARGDYAGAAAIYEEITRSVPVVEYVAALAEVQRAAGDGVAAEEATALVLAIDRLYSENGVNTDVEMVLFRADHGIDIPATVAHARRALALRPSIHAADALAWALYRAGAYEEAQSYVREALRLGTKDPLKHYHAGLIAEALGQPEVARMHLEQALAINPHFSVLYTPDARARVAALVQAEEHADAREASQ